MKLKWKLRKRMKNQLLNFNLNKFYKEKKSLNKMIKKRKINNNNLTKEEIKEKEEVDIEVIPNNIKEEEEEVIKE